MMVNILLGVISEGFGKSLIGKDWNENRGPDLFDDEEGFRKHILQNIEHRDFDKPNTNN